MRWFAPAFALVVALLLPYSGNLHADQFQTPAPRVNAAAAEWQIDGQPVLYEGDLYFATAERVFFDGHVMMPVGVYEGVPLYADATLEPFSVVFVPVASSMMRRYERRHIGEPTYADLSRPSWLPVPGTAAAQLEEYEARPVRTAGVTPRASGAEPASAPAAALTVSPAPIPRSRTASAIVGGVWVEYEGARWYSVGDAVSYSPDRFTSIGAYHGFPVYRRNRGDRDAIYIVAVNGGPLSRYERSK
jgi:hypothetical protein